MIDGRFAGSTAGWWSFFLHRDMKSAPPAEMNAVTMNVPIRSEVARGQPH
jgi:hypothetical protein